MARRRFDHMLVELSVAAGRVLPRYALWLRLNELGIAAEHLPRSAAIAFCDQHLENFLSEHRLTISDRARRRARRAIARFDARLPTPYEQMVRFQLGSL